MGSENCANSKISTAPADDDDDDDRHDKNNNSEFMQIAVAEGVEGVACGHGGPFGAVVVRRNGQIVARGHNMVLHTNDPTAHAEIVALRNASKALNKFDLSECTLYTSCYPCPMCLGAILWSRISKVFYAASPADASSVGFDDQTFYDFVQSPESHPKMLRIAHLPTKEHMAPFRKWAEKEDKRMY